MNRIPRTTAVVTVIAVALHFPTLAATGGTIKGTVEVPCDPSRVSDVASVQIRAVEGGVAATVPVDPSSGKFVSAELAEGEYEFMAIGADGEPLSPEPERLLVRDGTNKIALYLRPPGCGLPDADRDGIPDQVDACPGSPPGTAVGIDGCPETGTMSGKKRGIKDWQLTLIYFGVVGAVIFAVSRDDDEPASPFSP